MTAALQRGTLVLEIGPDEIVLIDARVTQKRRGKRETSRTKMMVQSVQNPAADDRGRIIQKFIGSGSSRGPSGSVIGAGAGSVIP